MPEGVSTAGSPRKSAGSGDARKSGASGDARKSPAAGDARKSSSSGDARKNAAPGEARKSSSSGDARKNGAAADPRKSAPAAEVRKFAAGTDPKKGAAAPAAGPADGKKASSLEAMNKALGKATDQARKSEVEAEEPEESTPARPSLTERYPFLKLPQIGSGVSEKDLVLFTRQFATMVNSGLPLIQVLRVLTRQTTNPIFREQLVMVKRVVEGGGTLAEALRRHPQTFDAMYVNLVAAGETSGVLDGILNRLAQYIERSAHIKRQIKIAMVYPTAILIVAAVVVALLLLKVVPVFERMFGEFGQGLPSQTQMVIDFSQFVQAHFLVVSIALAAAVVGLVSSYQRPKGRYMIDRVLLGLPVFGDIVIKVSVARFCRTMGTMLASGVPILKAMDICSRIVGNKVVEEALMRGRKGVSEGKSVAGPLRASRVFPDMVCQMISVGEATGALDTMLSKLADFYEEEVEAAVSAMASLIEPAMMVFLGVVIGGLVIAMYMPVFTMASAVGG